MGSLQRRVRRPPSYPSREPAGPHVIFCDPHSPWQKGSVENINGRLRRYLPGELDLSIITPAHLNEIETRMNTTPRKCLGFRTPIEAFAAAAG